MQTEKKLRVVDKKELHAESQRKTNDQKKRQKVDPCCNPKLQKCRINKSVKERQRVTTKNKTADVLTSNGSDIEGP